MTQQRMTAAEFRRTVLGEADIDELIARKQHKYGAKPTTYKGVRYDSKLEAEWAARIDLLVASGVYLWVLRQVPVVLGDDHATAVKTRVDFVVQESGGTVVGIEPKGMKTPAFRRVLRAWEAHGPFLLRVVYGDGSAETICGKL